MSQHYNIDVQNMVRICIIHSIKCLFNKAHSETYFVLQTILMSFLFNSIVVLFSSVSLSTQCLMWNSTTLMKATILVCSIHTGCMLTTCRCMLTGWVYVNRETNRCCFVVVQLLSVMLRQPNCCYSNNNVSRCFKGLGGSTRDP